MKFLLSRTISRGILQPYARWSRATTLGVRIAVLRKDAEIFLVRHSYVPGWHFPGGGVERCETPPAAAEKELREEGNIRPLEPLQLQGFYWAGPANPRDYIVLYILRDFERGEWSPDLEIREARFFSLNELPEDLTSGTRRRIAEIVTGEKRADQW